MITNKTIFNCIFWILIFICISVLTFGMTGILKEIEAKFEKCGENEIIVKKEIVYMHQFGTVEDPYREDLHGPIEESCIRTLRSFGADIPYGVEPRDLEPNTEIEIGVVALFTTEGGRGHGALVTSIEENGFWVKEGNYVAGKITERFIEFSDYRLRGYYKHE